VEPKPTEPPKPTEEEIAAQKKEQEERDLRFIQTTSEALKPKIAVSEADMEVILEGGEAAAAKMSELLVQQHATVMLETRRGVYDDVNAYIESLESRLKPVFSQQDELQKVAVETQFLQTFPEYGENEQALKAARQVAEQLVTNFPEETSKMDLNEFVEEVDRQTSNYLTSQVKMWNPKFEGDWRAFQQANLQGGAPAPEGGQTPPAQPAQGGQTPPAQAPQGGAPAAPAAPARKRPKAPAANAPAATSVVGDPHAKSWQKQTAASLAD
jgi:hypothetical protein